MNRALYRCLIALHPRAFRERFGDEMLSVFDEATYSGASPLFIDGVSSLVRQWLLRSGLWKFALGAAVSALCLSFWLNTESHRISKIPPADVAQQSEKPLDHAQFNRDTAGAIAFLARFRETNNRKSRKRSAGGNSSTNRDDTSQD